MSDPSIDELRDVAAEKLWNHRYMETVDAMLSIFLHSRYKDVKVGIAKSILMVHERHQTLGCRPDILDELCKQVERSESGTSWLNVVVPQTWTIVRMRRPGGCTLDEIRGKVAEGIGKTLGTRLVSAAPHDEA